MKRLLGVLIASAFAAGGTIAFAQPTPSASMAANSDTTVQRRSSAAFADKERALQQESRSSASGAVSTGGDQQADKEIRSGDRKKDFAERERALSQASKSSASGHDKVIQTPRLTTEERRAMQREAAKDRAAQSQP